MATTALRVSDFLTGVCGMGDCLTSTAWASTSKDAKELPQKCAGFHPQNEADGVCPVKQWCGGPGGGWLVRWFP